MGKFYFTFLLVASSLCNVSFAQSNTIHSVANTPDLRVVTSAENFTVQKADPQSIRGNNTSVIIPPQEKIFFDYNSMPYDVKNRVSSNKANGKPLLDGVLKGYTVDIAACQSETSTKSILSFLTDMKGFCKVVFISPGKVKLIVQPELSSVDLKDNMLRSKLKFNFLEQFYLLK